MSSTASCHSSSDKSGCPKSCASCSLFTPGVLLITQHSAPMTLPCGAVALCCQPAWCFAQAGRWPAIWQPGKNPAGLLA